MRYPLPGLKMRRFAILACTAAIGVTVAAASIQLPMMGCDGDGKIVLADGRAALQFDATAPKDTRATWTLPTPLEPGWHTVELGFGPETNTRKLVNLEFLDAQQRPLLSLDAYHLPSRGGMRPVVVLGIYLARSASAIGWRKNQTRNLPSAPLVSLEIKPGRPADGLAFMEAVEAPVVSGKVMFPADLGGGLIRSVSTTPVALAWKQSDTKEFATPSSPTTPVFVNATLSSITLQSGTATSLLLERRFESKSPLGQDLGNRPVIPLVGPGKRELTIEVRGTALDGGAAAMADFPGGASMAAVQSWDDGVTQDKRNAGLLQKHGWRASFFFNHHSPMVGRWKELEDLGMEVGSHSWSHPAYWLQTPRRCHEESAAMRLFLESKVSHPVISFAYPFNYGAAYDASGDYVLRAQQDAGYLSCRSTMTGTLSLDDLGNPLAMSTNGHFLIPADCIEAAWKRAASTKRGVFYIWGHSYELVKETDWAAFERMLQQYGGRPEAWYASQGDLLVWQLLREQTKLSASGNANRVLIRLKSPNLHPWWAGRVPLAIQVPGHITSAEVDGKPLPVVNGQIQIAPRN